MFELLRWGFPGHDLPKGDKQGGRMVAAEGVRGERQRERVRRPAGVS